MKWKTHLLLTSFLSLLIWTSCRDDPYKQGRILYQNFCASCHMDDGSGLQGVMPPLANADYVAENQDKLACIIRYGMEGPIVVNDTTYNQAMAGIPQLTDFEITNIINYINHSWGSDYGYMPYADVKAALEECKP